MYYTYPKLKMDYSIIRSGSEFSLFNNIRKISVMRLGLLVGFILLSCNGSNTVEQISDLVSDIIKVSSSIIYKKIVHLLYDLSDYLEEQSGPNDSSSNSNVSDIFLYHASPEIIDFRNPFPHYIDFYITDNCQRRCMYCFVGIQNNASMLGSNSFLSVDRFYQISKEASSLGITSYNLTGGEPVLHPSFLDFVRISHDFGITVRTSTKANIGKEYLKAMYNAGLSTLQVSLDSIDPNIEDYLLGKPNSCREIKRTLENVLELGIDVTVRAVITSLNIDGIPELLSTLIDMGVKRIAFSFFGESCLSTNSDLYAPAKKIKVLNDSILKFKLQNPTITLQYNTDYLAVAKKRESKLQSSSVYLNRICMASVNGMKVRSDGRVVFCDQMLNVEEAVVGNLHIQGIEEIWKSEKMMDWLLPNQQKYKNTPCCTCSDFFKCYRHRCHKDIVIAYGSPYNKIPNCEVL